MLTYVLDDLADDRFPLGCAVQLAEQLQGVGKQEEGSLFDVLVLCRPREGTCLSWEAAGRAAFWASCQAVLTDPPSISRSVPDMLAASGEAR